ncbi:uncharacterized protein LOC128716093 [Anopheles marshallii]|uniref:uncharacterized protein LOC128716093 n=1 Tax=Anopheles marshallii TaxID=1521116 RepID=UPI00237BCC2D|nr:uncharacterized protein LOC128716093 [Anopheles marshallii]
MEICSSLFFETLAILAFGGTFQRRRKFGRDVLLGHCCMLMLLVFCWQQSPAQGASWRNSAKLYKSDDDYYETDDSYETDEDDKHHVTGGINLGASTLHADKDSVEIEYEELDHHHHNLPNGVAASEESSEDQPDSFNNSELLAQLGLQHKTPRAKKKGRKSRPPPVTIAVPYPVHIERKVPVFIEKKVPVIVEKKVEVPVDRPYEVPVPVQVPVLEKEVVHVPKPIVFNVDRPYPVYVHRTVFVEKYRPFKVLIKSRTRY